MKPLKIVLAFSSFTGLTQAYLVKTSIAHNNYSTPRFLEDSDPTSAESAAQIVIFKPSIDFPSFEILITGL